MNDEHRNRIDNSAQPTNGAAAGPDGQPACTRRPTSERESAFNALAWLIEGAAGVMEELRHNDFGLSQEFWMHAQAAHREGLLALRALLDEVIERSSAEKQAELERQKRRQQRGKIEIDP